MKFDYDEIIELVDEILPEFGLDCTATLEKPAEYDPETGLTTGSIESTGKGVLTNFNSYDSAQNNLIEAGDMRLLATESLLLEVGSIVDISGEEWQVINPNPIKPANKIVMYKAHVRRV